MDRKARQGFARLAPFGLAERSARIRELAACPKVHIKLGSSRACSGLTPGWWPYIETCIAARGPEPAMFEDNYPSAFQPIS